MKDLIELYHISSPSHKEDEMHEHIIKKLCNIGLTVNVDSANNIYGQFGKGETYPCIVAHTDEVHQAKPEDFEVLEHKGNYFGFSDDEKDFVGIGADDKNGIWIALKIAKAFVKAEKPIKVAFFPGEECGCIGSSKAELDFFKDCRFVLQCDRRGGSDFITKANGVDLCSKEFLSAVAPLLKKYGYKETCGLTTDVYELKCNELAISVANMSCGYYNAHTNREMTNISELKNALELANKIMQLKDVFPHKAEIVKTAWTWNNGYKYDYNGYYNGNWQSSFAENAKAKREINYYYYED